jgi:hypothetical protein
MQSSTVPHSGSHDMQRRARERIIAKEILKLERQQAAQRTTRRLGDRPEVPEARRARDAIPRPA